MPQKNSALRLLCRNEVAYKPTKFSFLLSDMNRICPFIVAIAVPANHNPSETIAAPQALAVNGLERCVASRHTQNNTDLAVTPGDTMSGRGIWPYSLIQLRSLKAQLVLAVSLVVNLPFSRVR